MKREIDLRLLIVMLIAAWLVLSLAPVYAGDECRGNSCNGGGDTDIDVGGDQIDIGGDTINVPVTTGGVDINAPVSTKTRALSVSGADMAINDGYRTYSYLFGLIQETKANPLTVANDLAREGNYEAAARLRCSPRTIWRAFGSKEECVSAIMTMPFEPAAEPVVIIDDSDDDEFEDQYHEEQAEIHADLETKYENLQRELAKTRMQVSQQQQQQAPVDQELLLRLEEEKRRREKAKAILQKGDE